MTTAQVKQSPYKPQPQFPEERLERRLDERRNKLEHMYLMLANMERAIVGEGFSIMRVNDPNGDYFTVYRRTFGTENVKSLTRVATMFTPEMFMDGITTLSPSPSEGEGRGGVLTGCPALPGASRCTTIDR